MALENQYLEQCWWILARTRLESIFFSLENIIYEICLIYIFEYYTVILAIDQKLCPAWTINWFNQHFRVIFFRIKLKQNRLVSFLYDWSLWKARMNLLQQECQNLTYFLWFFFKWRLQTLSEAIYRNLGRINLHWHDISWHQGRIEGVSTVQVEPPYKEGGRPRFRPETLLDDGCTFWSLCGEKKVWLNSI